jgi:hypothetical protein
MTLESHPHIKFVTSEIEFQLDGTKKIVWVVFSDLQLNNLYLNFDQSAFDELVAHIQAFREAHGIRDIRVKTVI